MVQLNEGGLSRTYQMMNDPKKVFAIISAERQDKSRTKSLIQDITNLGYGFTHMAGGYWEEGQLEPGYEHSLFIPNIKKDEALKLGGKYEQDTILYKDSSGMKYYKPNGEVDSEFSTDELTVDDNFQLDKVKPYFSRRLKGGNQRNAFSFKPKEESLCLFAYEPYTNMGKHRAYLNAVSESDYITDYTRPPKDWYKKTMGEKYMKKQVNEQMYDDLGNARTPEEWAKGISDGTVNEAKEADEHEVNELVLYMENTQKHYNSIMAVVKNLAKKMAKGNFDKELAVKGMMYPVNDAARAYKKEFSGEGYEKYDFNPATRKAVAEELLDRYMEDIESEAGAKNEMYDEYGNHITPEEYAKGVADGTINESFKLSKSDKEYLKSIGNDDEDLPQIEKVGRSKKTKFELDDTEITSDEAIKVLGKEKFLAGLSRCAFHKSAKQSNNGKSVHFVCESVEDESDDNMLALEDYFVSAEGEDPSEVEIKAGYTDNLYDTPWGEYYVFGNYEDAKQAAVDYEKQTLEEIGINALNWNYMPYEIGHYVNRDWFQAAMEESNQFFVDGMSNMDKMDYLEDILDESDFREAHRGELEEVVEADSDIDSMDLYDMLDALDMFSEYDEEIVEKLNNIYADPIDWYKDSFGDEDFGQVVIEKNLVDLDAVAEAVVETDGPANALARYDGEEIEWEFNGNYYYIYRAS